MWLSALSNLIPAAVVAVVLARLWRPLRNLPARTSLGYALCCAAILRLLWIAFTPGVQTADFAWYYDRANSIVAGDGYAVDGRLTAYFPVGYSFFLSLLFRVTGPSVLAGQLTNVILALLGIAMIEEIGRRIFDEETGRCAAWVQALFPGQIFYTALLASEGLSQFCVLAAVWAALRAVDGRRDGPWAVLAGLALGFGTLARPPCAFVGPALLVLWRMRKRSWRDTLRLTTISALASFAVLTPWLVRNHRVFGVPLMLSSNVGVNFWQGNNPAATGSYHLVEGEYKDRMFAELHGMADEAERSRVFFGRGLDFVREHPGQAVWLCVRKLYYMYDRDEEGLWFSFFRHRDDAEPSAPRWLYGGGLRVAVAYHAFVMLLATAAVFVGFASGGGERGRVLQALLPVLAVTLAYMPFHTEDRFSHNVMPFLELLAVSLWLRLRVGPAGEATARGIWLR